MIDTNWKTWGALFLIAIGISFELLKSFGGGVAAKFDTEALVKGQPYSVRRAAQPVRQQLPRTQPARVAGQSTPSITREQLEKFVAQAGTSAATSFEEGKTAAKEKGGEGKDGKKEKSKCDSEGHKLDPKTLKPMVDQNTGMPVMCKKKKKKEDEEKPVAQPETKKEDHAKNDNVDSLMNQAIATGELPQPVPQAKDDGFGSLEDWMKRLLNFPSKEETQRFIDAYQRNMVTAEIFYKITALMMNDSRPEMKRLGVLCAGVTPSVLSFQLLAGLIKDERQGSEPRRDAEGFLSRYSDMANLTIVERVMRSNGEASATIMATQKLDVSANHYLKVRENPSATPKQQAAQAAALKKAASFFQRFVALLTELSTKNSDRDVKDQATRTLSGLQSLLTAATSAAGPVTDPSTPPTTTGPVAAQTADGF